MRKCLAVVPTIKRYTRNFLFCRFALLALAVRCAAIRIKDWVAYTAWSIHFYAVRSQWKQRDPSFEGGTLTWITQQLFGDRGGARGFPPSCGLLLG